MSLAPPALPKACDVIVVGSGAAGSVAALTAHQLGLDVLLLEKEDHFGGTTAVSGGWAWLPRSRLASEQGLEDSEQAVLDYLRHSTQGTVNERILAAFIEEAPKAVAFLHDHTRVRLNCPPHSPDYMREAPGGSAGGRALMCEPLDGRQLGGALALLQPPLPELTLYGMMLGSGRDVLHFYRASRSVRSAAFVAWRLARHAYDMLLHGRGMTLTNGTALAARFLLSLKDRAIPIYLGTSVVSLVRENGRISGVDAMQGNAVHRICARRGVVLACGGFSRDEERTREFSHVRSGGFHFPLAPAGVTGDGLRLAQSVGADIVRRSQPAAWAPVSRVPRADGSSGLFPHFVDRAKPGVIAVDRDARRFVNEATNYHGFVQALQATAGPGRPPRAFLIADARAIRWYGLGAVAPAPVSRARFIRSGYLHKAPTVNALAHKLQLDPTELAATVERFNIGAAQGLDPDFGRGSTEHNRYMGDAWITPNPCLRPLDQPPFYAVEIQIGDLGTFSGVSTDEGARALDSNGLAIAGLYVAGNDMASCMGGSYPGAGATIGAALVFGRIAAQTIFSDTAAMVPSA
ncbi:MAG: hypothetical protein RIS88_300 [Pseudomonadota bacterium]|jgi:succinate dehydrogenase/fumarate reductase flavoprotein subunit